MLAHETLDQKATNIPIIGLKISPLLFIYQYFVFLFVLVTLFFEMNKNEVEKSTFNLKEGNMLTLFILYNNNC